MKILRKDLLGMILIGLGCVNSDKYLLRWIGSEWIRPEQLRSDYM